MSENKLFHNMAFNVGFWLGILLCVVSNYVSYAIAFIDYHDGPQFSPFNGFNWGFPFHWKGGGFGGLEVIANGFIFTFFCFGLGLLFRFVWAKISSSKIKE